MDVRYLKKRESVEAFFTETALVRDDRQVVVSPFGDYELTIDPYSTGPHTWKYSRGRVRRSKSPDVIADVKRNYGHFWHAWVRHANGNDYLLCGEDYQGQTVVNLSTGGTVSYFPEEGHDGTGFCWTVAFPSPDTRFLAVEGCVWACPYEVVFFDFSDPDQLPYPELLRVADLYDSLGWQDDGSFRMTREIEVRKSDGKPYEDLSEDEQVALDEDASLIDVVKHDVTITRDQLARGTGD